MSLWSTTRKCLTKFSSQALFIAAGPHFKKGYVSQLPVNNIDLVPMFAKLSGVENVPTDGTFERVQLLLENDYSSSAMDSAGVNVAILSIVTVIVVAMQMVFV